MGYHGHLTQSTQLIRVLLKRRIHDLKLEDNDWIEVIRRNGIKDWLFLRGCEFFYL